MRDKETATRTSGSLPATPKIMVANITEALVAADPSGASTYEANQRAYDAELDALDRGDRSPS